MVGSIASTLFGLATESQLEGLNNILTNINELTDENASKLNILNKIVELSTDRIDKMRHAQIKTLNSIEIIVNQTRLLAKLQKNSEHREIVTPLINLL